MGIELTVKLKKFLKDHDIKHTSDGWWMTSVEGSYISSATHCCSEVDVATGGLYRGQEFYSLMETICKLSHDKSRITTRLTRYPPEKPQRIKGWKRICSIRSGHGGKMVVDYYHKIIGEQVK